MRAAVTAIGMFGAVILFCAYAFLRAWSEQRHGYGKKPITGKPSSAITPASFPRPARRFEREQEPRGM